MEFFNEHAQISVGELGLFEYKLAHEVVVLVGLDSVEEVLGKVEFDPLLVGGGNDILGGVLFLDVGVLGGVFLHLV